MFYDVQPRLLALSSLSVNHDVEKNLFPRRQEEKTRAPDRVIDLVRFSTRRKVKILMAGVKEPLRNILTRPSLAMKKLYFYLSIYCFATFLVRYVSRSTSAAM